jgi:hypothetical protein
MRKILKIFGLGLTALFLVLPVMAWANRMEDIQGRQSEGEFAIEAGPGVATNGYGFGFNFGGSAGIKFDKNFSLLSELEFHTYTGGATAVGTAYNVQGISSAPYIQSFQLCVLGKYRITEMRLRPFFFGGLGIGNVSIGDTTNVGGVSAQGGTAQWAPILEGGGGLEFKIDPRMSWFVQAKFDLPFVSQPAGEPSIGSPIYIPVQAGLDLLL